VLPTRRTGLAKYSVASVSQIVALARSVLSAPVGRLTESELRLVVEWHRRRARGEHNEPLKNEI
jgi:mRNA-degrading endonuclease toxin of MazEF toxin-antitoxin module